MIRLTAVALALAAIGLAGCDQYAKPNRPLPDSLVLHTLDGATLRPSDLAGKPWVISIWVPG